MFSFFATGTPQSDFTSTNFDTFWSNNEIFIYWFSAVFLSACLFLGILEIIKKMKKTTNKNFK